MLLVGIYGLLDGGHRGVGAEAVVAGQCLAAALQGHLRECQLAYLLVLSRARHLVVRCHHGVAGLHTHRFGAVDGHVDYLSGYAQTVEVGTLGAVAAERKSAGFIELNRVDNRKSLKSVVLEVEHGVLGVLHVALNVELLAHAGAEQSCCGHGYQWPRNRNLHIVFVFSVCFARGSVRSCTSRKCIRVAKVM